MRTSLGSSFWKVFIRNCTISSDCNDPSVGPCHLSAVRLRKVTTTGSAAVEMDGGRLLSCLAGGGAAAAVLINHADGVDKRHRQ